MRSMRFFHPMVWPTRSRKPVRKPMRESQRPHGRIADTSSPKRKRGGSLKRMVSLVLECRVWTLPHD
jgi:hypothetical protein